MKQLITAELRSSPGTEMEKKKNSGTVKVIQNTGIDAEP